MERPEFSSEISIAKSQVEDATNNTRDRYLHYFLWNRISLISVMTSHNLSHKRDYRDVNYFAQPLSLCFSFVWLRTKYDSQKI